MELLQLTYFCTVARLENISKAAREHMIPQPAMSKTISRLENELAVQLFERKGNRISLTEKGKQFYAYIDRGLTFIHDATEAVREERDSQDIYLLLNTNRDIILKFISQFIIEHPDANFIIDHNNSAETLDAVGHALHHHLCVSALPVRREFDQSIPLLRERLMIAVPKSNPLSKCSVVSFEQLASERFVLLAERFRMHTYFLSYCETTGFSPHVSMYCADPSYVRHAVDNGLGISVMPEKSWLNLLGPNTALLPLEGDPLYQTHRILWDSNRYLPTLARLFRDELVAHYRGMFGSMHSHA